MPILDVTGVHLLEVASVLTMIFHPGVHGNHREAKRGSLGRKAGHNFLDTVNSQCLTHRSE